VGLIAGDLIRQLLDCNGTFATTNEGDATVFLRYLTEGGHNSIACQGALGERFFDADIVICYSVQGCAILDPADSRITLRFEFKK